MKRILVFLLLCASVASAAGDPCNSTEPKLSAAIGLTVDTVIVTGVANRQIVVCGFSAHVSGTTPTMRFVHGSGTTCATGITGLTGAYAPANAGQVITSHGTMTQFTVPASATAQDLCVDVGGTAAVQGYLTYIRK